MSENSSAEHWHEWNRSEEGQAAYVIYEKYKREFGFVHEDLLDFGACAVIISERRAKLGKKANRDYIIQELSRLIDDTLRKYE